MPSESPKKRSAKKKGKTEKPGEHGVRLYTLNVELTSGPVTEEFAEKNPTVSRAIQIRGDQTLESLHYAIYAAFNREEEHLYEFQFGPRPQHARNKRYGPSSHMENDWLGFDDPEEDAECLVSTAIESLGLKRRTKFWYWFDFGDDWWHRIEVIGVEDAPPRGKFPKVVKRVGASPPQYPDWDE
jgi:hypothetical protein